jgi:hypothetical protein
MRDVKLRHAMLHAVEGLLLPEIGQETAPGRPKLDCLVELSRRLRSSRYDARNRGGGSSRGSNRGQADGPRVAFANPGRIAAWIRRNWFRSL